MFSFFTNSDNEMLVRLQKLVLEFLNLSRFENDDSEGIEVLQKSALLHFLLFVGFLIQFSFFFVSLPKGFYLLAILELTTLIVIVFLFFYLKKTADYFRAARVYAIILGGFFQYLIFSGGIGNNGHVWSFLYPVGILFFFGHRTGLKISIFFLIVSVLNLTTISVYKAAEDGFQLRFVSVYISLTMIVYVYESTKNRLHKTILMQNMELKEARIKAEKADKLKSDFLAQMSHEIRTPVNTILNYTSLLRAEFEPQLTGELKEFFNSINIASSRLIRTIDLILNISTVESGSYTPHFEKLMLSSDIILHIAEEFEQYATAKNLELIFIPEIESEISLSLDRYTISQALSNLVDNAIKYTHKGKVEIRLSRNSDKIMINVTDTGIGISREYLPSLFEKFSQETQGYTRIYEGNGLGLALVKEYCRINGAEIKVSSEKGIGTTFTIELPIS